MFGDLHRLDDHRQHEQHRHVYHQADQPTRHDRQTSHGRAIRPRRAWEPAESCQTRTICFRRLGWPLWSSCRSSGARPRSTLSRQRRCHSASRRYRLLEELVARSQLARERCLRWHSAHARRPYSVFHGPEVRAARPRPGPERGRSGATPGGQREGLDRPKTGRTASLIYGTRIPGRCKKGVAGQFERGRKCGPFFSSYKEFVSEMAKKVYICLYSIYICFRSLSPDATLPSSL